MMRICENCKQLLSETAKFCPFCGCPAPGEKRHVSGKVWVGIVVVCLAVISLGVWGFIQKNYTSPRDISKEYEIANAGSNTLVTEKDSDSIIEANRTVENDESIISNSESAELIDDQDSGFLNDNQKTFEIDQKNPSEEFPEEVTENTDNTAETAYVDWISDYKEKGIEVIPVRADDLYAHSEEYDGRTVVTMITIKEVDDDHLSAGTENNKSFHYSIIADFTETKELSRVKEDDSVIVIGTVKMPTEVEKALEEEVASDFLEFFFGEKYFGKDTLLNQAIVSGSGDTVSIKDCHIIDCGIEEFELVWGDELGSLSTDTEDIKAKKGNVLEEYRKDFVASCNIVDYIDVQRNPNSHKESNVLIEGNVIQVSEGILGNVTLRVDEGRNKIWYVSYVRADDDEPRIIEGDKVKLYGKCKGLKTYIAVLGQSVTIPWLSAEFYELMN